MAEEKREIVFASLAGDGEGITGILDFAGVFPNREPVCVVRTPSSVMSASPAIDLAGELNFIGEPGGKGISSICCFSCAGTGSLMDPEAVLFAGTGRPPACPFVTLSVGAESKFKSARTLTSHILKHTWLKMYLLFLLLQKCTARNSIDNRC